MNGMYDSTSWTVENVVFKHFINFIDKQLNHVYFRGTFAKQHFEHKTPDSYKILKYSYYLCLLFFRVNATCMYLVHLHSYFTLMTLCCYDIIFLIKIKKKYSTYNIIENGSGLLFVSFLGKNPNNLTQNRRMARNQKRLPLS